jgi:hypothetical protein
MFKFIDPLDSLIIFFKYAYKVIVKEIYNGY